MRLKWIIWFSLLASIANAQWTVPHRRAAFTEIDLKTSLIAYYKLDEASGNAVDAHDAKNLTQSGSPGSEAGVISNCRNFNSSNSFDGGDDASFEPGSGSFFATFWTRPGSLDQGSYPTIVGKQDSWIVNFNQSSKTPYLSVTKASNPFDVNAAANVFANTSTWVFIAVGRDATNIMISINGGAFVTTAFTGSIDGGTNSMRIGGRSTGFYNGAIDEVAFWKGRCLTLTEVQAIYNAGAGKAYSTWQ